MVEDTIKRIILPEISAINDQRDQAQNNLVAKETGPSRHQPGKSDSSLLIKYFEGPKCVSDKTTPSVRVKVTPSLRKKTGAIDLLPYIQPPTTRTVRRGPISAAKRGVAESSRDRTGANNPKSDSPPVAFWWEKRRDSESSSETSTNEAG